METNPQTFIFFGRSGSGKGTQAKLLKTMLEEKKREVLYLETGNMFRDFVRDTAENYTASLVKKTMDEGGLLPPFLPIWAWTSFFVKNLTGNQDIILDGLGRRADEIPVLESALSFYKREKLVVVIITTSNDWCKTRLLERGRSDDSKKDIDERLAWFDRDVAPAIALLRTNPNYVFFELNGEQPVEQVHDELMSKIESM